MNRITPEKLFFPPTAAFVVDVVVVVVVQPFSIVSDNEICRVRKKKKKLD